MVTVMVVVVMIVVMIVVRVMVVVIVVRVMVVVVIVVRVMVVVPRWLFSHTCTCTVPVSNAFLSSCISRNTPATR